MNPKRVFFHIASLVILLSALTGCNSGTSAPSVTETSAVETTAAAKPDDGTWAMQAVLVDRSGNVLETLELTLNVMQWEQEGRGYYAAYFHYPDNIYYSVSGVKPYPEDEVPYLCCPGLGTETGLSGKTTGTCYFALDLDKECFIADFNDDQDVYLIGYRSSDTDISALWDYLQDFLDMIPDEFPTASG